MNQDLRYDSNRNFYHTPATSQSNYPFGVGHDYSKQRRKEDLLFNPRNFYKGETHLFWSWKVRLEKEIQGVNASDMDIIYIIQSHTSGRPRAIVDNLIASAGHEPRLTLSRIWDTLTTRFGSSHKVANDLLMRINAFPAIKTVRQISSLEDLLDLCRIIEANIPHCQELYQMNLSCGMKKVWEKLPDFLQQRWRKTWYTYETATCQNPHFYVFIDFLNKIIEEFSIPGFASTPLRTGGNSLAKTLKTTAADTDKRFISCAYHPGAKHQLFQCKALKNLPYKKVREMALAAKVCFRCLQPHLFKNCNSSAKCEKCGRNHITAMHNEGFEISHRRPQPNKKGEPVTPEAATSETVTPGASTEADKSLSLCTVGNEALKGGIFSKTVLVEVRLKHSQKSIFCYCILDEQSNTSFVDHKIVECLELNPPETQYFMTTMQGVTSYVNGHVVDNLEVRGVYESNWLSLPQLFTSDSIPDTRFEVATSDDVILQSHLSHLADKFIKTVGRHEVLMLIGCNCGPAMATEVFGSKAPFAHHTALGWALVGPSGVDENSPNSVVLKTSAKLVDHLNANVTFPINKSLSLRLYCRACRRRTTWSFQGRF